MFENLDLHGLIHTPPQEGDLYKEVTVCGKRFRLEYGYYESFERDNPFTEPIPIYPDLLRDPQYTKDGTPVVTAMQNVCRFYHGKKDEDSCCFGCVFFQRGEDLFGLCRCPQNKRGEENRQEQA